MSNVRITENGLDRLTEAGALRFAEGRSVLIAPTDDVNDASAMEQIITAEAATEITMTSVQGALAASTNLYLFVVTAAGLNNAAGFVVQFIGSLPRGVLVFQAVKRASYW